MVDLYPVKCMTFRERGAIDQSLFNVTKKAIVIGS